MQSSRVMPLPASSGMRTKAPGPTLRTSTVPLVLVFGRVSSITVSVISPATPAVSVAGTPSSA